ncbi:DUF6644 family protein [Dongia deserti]|uniref:DUF6644 family protein n=1 Tax=Dongia deserti TaxID=2268030 RepID=UPI0025496C4B|nr:DUF6644 family protein [Dongia deserti]
MEDQPAALIFLALQESALGHLMRASPALYPAVEILHIMGFVLLVGAITALDLRLLGLARTIPIQPLAHLLLPLSRVGFIIAVAMGFLLFSADAAHVVRNPAFQAKLLLIVAALINIVIAHTWPWRRIAKWEGEAPTGAKATALASLVLWLSALTAGRLIAYF